MRAEDSLLPLTDVLSPSVGFEWSHGVAIALQVVHQLMPDGRFVNGTFPDADRIALSPGGFLLTQFEPAGQEPLAGFGRLLHRLLAHTSPPAALRLLVMQASAARPTVILEDVIRDLRKWETPNRREMLAILHTRVCRHDPAAAPTPSIVTAPEKRGRQHSRADGAPGRSLAPHLVIAAAAAGTVGVLATFFVLGPKGPDTPPIPLIGFEVTAAAATPPMPSPIALPASAVLEQDAARGARAATHRTSAPGPSAPAAARAPRPPIQWPSRSAPAGVSAPAGARPGVPANAEAVVARSAAAAGLSVPANPETVGYSAEVMRDAEDQFRRARLLFEQHDYVAAADAFREVVDVLGRGDPTLELRLIADELASASRALAVNAATVAAHVYTSADEGVTEPVALATLPPPARPNTPASQVGVLELLIDARGQVESARLVGDDQHFRDRWLISAAKAWLFEPATKDGRAVRFLKRHAFLLDSHPGLQ